MKDIIEVPEGKRAADQLREGAMQRRIFRFAVAALTIGLWSGLSLESARAQDGEWMEPGGRFALGFEMLGWTATPAVANPPNIMAFVRNDSPRDDRMRICFVSQIAVPHSEGASQASANQILDRWDETRLSQVIGSPVRDLAHTRAEGVSVIDYREQREHLDVMARFFLIEGGRGMDQITISCGFPAPLTSEEVASIVAAFNTLRIVPRDHQ